jgi:hypothetical protein
VRACGLREHFQRESLESQEPQLVLSAHLSEHASCKLLDTTIAEMPHALERHVGRPQLGPPLLTDVERQHPHDGAVETRVVADSPRHEVNDAARALVRFKVPSWMRQAPLKVTVRHVPSFSCGGVWVPAA